MPPELHAAKLLFYAKSVGEVTSGHVTKIAVKPFDPPLPKTPWYTQTVRLYLLWNQSYRRPIKVLHCRNREFRIFLRKIAGNIEILLLCRKSDADDTKTYFLAYYWQFQLVCYRSYTRSRCCFTPHRWAWSLPVTWQRWWSNHSIRHFCKPLAIRKLHGSIFYRTGVIVFYIA